MDTLSHRVVGALRKAFEERGLPSLPPKALLELWEMHGCMRFLESEVGERLCSGLDDELLDEFDRLHDLFEIGAVPQSELDDWMATHRPNASEVVAETLEDLASALAAVVARQEASSHDRSQTEAQ